MVHRDRGGLDGVADGDLTREDVERAAHLGHQVADDEADLRVCRVYGPGAGAEAEVGECAGHVVFSSKRAGVTAMVCGAMVCSQMVKIVKLSTDS